MATRYGSVHSFPIPEEPRLGYNPGTIVPGADGNMWFLNVDSEPWFRELRQDAIGKVTPEGSITEFPLPEKQQPSGLIQGPDGNLWFLAQELTSLAFPPTLSPNSSIERMTPTGHVTPFPLAPSSEPRDLALGPEGDIWFTEPGVKRIGRASTSGEVKEFPAEGLGGSSQIVLGSDGNLWFTLELPLSGLGRINPAGEVTLFPDVTPDGAAPQTLVQGPPGELWFATERSYVVPQIGHYEIPLVPTVQSAPVISGTPAAGQVLTASPGDWSNNPTSFVYRWQRCDADGEGCIPVDTDTGASYAIAEGDVNHTLRVSVTASGTGGHSTAVSDHTALVHALPPPTPVVGQPHETTQPTQPLPTHMTWRFGVGRSFSELLTLTLLEVPKQSSVEVLCAKHRCQFHPRARLAPGITFRCAARGCSAGPLSSDEESIPLLGLFKQSKLAPSTTLLVRVSKTGWLGKQFSFQMRKRRPTQVGISCLPTAKTTTSTC